MVKELAFYQFNFLDSISERVNSRLSILNPLSCEVYQNLEYAIIICPRQNISGCLMKKYPEFRDIFLFSPYKESLVRVFSNDYNLISSTIFKIMGVE